MLFAIIGRFRVVSGIEAPGFEAGLSEHLAQPLLKVRLAGALRDRDGQHIGTMIVMEADNFPDAQAYLQQSPYFKADRYEQIDVVEYALEVGSGDFKR